MSKYLVETFYTCTFKVKHFLDKIDQKELNLPQVPTAKIVTIVITVIILIFTLFLISNIDSDSSPKGDNSSKLNIKGL